MPSVSTLPTLLAHPPLGDGLRGESRYRSLCLLGHGGMGSVEAVAEDLDDGTTRVVALKRILRNSGTDAARLEMFLREARLTTLLSHPNVIRSLAYGESAGEVFLAMEYVAGEPLSRVLSLARERREPLPLPVLAFILSEACEGLHAAHELRGPDGDLLGVVHRDVSPHNVMVGYDGAVKLLDFGVAKIDLVDCAARTKTGEVKGKTAYMSPEQAMGEVVDRRSDLYSLGAVLFECVTGARMWGAGTDFDVLRRLALEEPPALAKVAPEVPPGLAALFDRLIARDRDRRPATAQEVALALRAHAVMPAGKLADAESVREAMTRLFDAERRQREAVIEQALRSGPVPSRDLPKSRHGAAGESAPVFVTHQEVTAASEGAARTRLLPSVAAAAALVALLGAFTLVHSRGEAKADARPLASPPHAGVPLASPAVASLPSADPTPPPKETGVAVHDESVPRPAPPLPAVVRRAATPHVRAAPTSVTTAAPPSASAPAPLAPPKTPELPDFDPNPF